MKTLSEKIEVMQAAESGEGIRVKPWEAPECSWGDIETKDITWDWVGWDYCVKPKPREIWMNAYSTTPSGGCSYYSSRKDADAMAGTARKAVIRFVEVERIPASDD